MNAIILTVWTVDFPAFFEILPASARAGCWRHQRKTPGKIACSRARVKKTAYFPSFFG
jgi:hypothetical protein